MQVRSTPESEATRHAKLSHYNAYLFKGSRPESPVKIGLHVERPVMSDEDLSYFEARAATELGRAREARHPLAIRAHYALAELYLERINSRSIGSPTGMPDGAETVFTVQTGRRLSL